MSLVEAKCTNCGAKLEVDNTQDAAICPACNTPFIVEKAINNITNNITNENHINASNVTIVQNESVSVENGMYEGETKSGKPNGYGVCQYSDGSKYEGDWLAGVRCGDGIITYDNGLTWKGIWKSDKPYTGSGAVFDYKERYYVGDYKNGKANGDGTFYYNNGKEWKGTVKDDKEWTGEGYIGYYDSFGTLYQTFEGKISNGNTDDNGEWHCNGHFRIDGVAFDVKNDVLNYVLTSSSQTIHIPDGIKKVDKHVRGFSGVTEIICPFSLTDFYAEDLDQFEELESFEAPGIIKVHKEMLCGLPNLKSVKLVNAEIVGENAFKECSNLSHLEIQNVKTIKSEAFAGCSNLESVNIPKAKIIEDGGFAGCGLSELFNIANVTKIGYHSLSGASFESLNAPRLEEIGEEAFELCESLKTINVPKLKTIREEAFLYCSALIEFSSESVVLIENKAFDGCEELIKINCPNATLDIGDYKGYYHFSRCDKLQEIKLADEVNISKLQTKTKSSSGGCYVATCVYGSYDCPQVWTLRRFRDNTLASTWYGRAFIRTYYIVSPTLVKWFGNTNWFKDMWKPALDYMVLKLNYKGVSNKPYDDK